MKAVIGDDAFGAPGAEGEAGLAELLGDDLGGGVGIEEAVADDLADGLVGAAGGALGAALAALQGGGAVGEEGAADLEVALFAEAELLGGSQGAEPLALAFDEHGEFAGDFVGGGDGEGAGGAGELLELGVEVKHGGPRRGGNAESGGTGEGRMVAASMRFARSLGGTQSPGEKIGTARAQSNQIWRHEPAEQRLSLKMEWKIPRNSAI